MEFEPNEKYGNRYSRWWRGRTRMENYLLILITLTAIVSFSIILILAVPHKTESKIKQLCLTTGCIQSASTVLNYMDSTINPCEDFYRFSCGNFLKKQNIPEDKTQISIFSKLRDKVQEQIKEIINDPLMLNSSKPFRLIKEYYNICMNTTAIENDGLSTVKDILNQLGGWPLLEGENWNEDEFEWKELVYKLRNLGFVRKYFMGISVTIDYKNSSRRAITLGSANLGLSREFLIKGMEEKLVRAYFDYMVDVAVIFGASKENAIKESKDVVEFEIQLAQMLLPKEKLRNASATYNPMTIKEMNQKYPAVDWLEYFNKLINVPSISVNENEIIIVREPQYITKMLNLLQTTSKRIQANYIISKVVRSTVAYLTNELRDRQLQYTKILNGKSERQPRWKECTKIATGSIYLATGSAYVKKFVNKMVKEKVSEIVTNVKTEFLSMLKQVDWMDEGTKENAIRKAMAITAHIAYPDELLENKNIVEYYDKLEMNFENYLKATKSLDMFYIDLSYKRLREPVNKSDWIDLSTPTTVNAFYLPSKNTINLPAGILQDEFFNENRPRYMNYGGIGFVIGHEITHGFDDMGKQFDQNGNLHNWWGQQTEEAFTEKAQCVIEQYGNYTVTEIGLNLNGINTQGENIADNGGIEEAYLAYNNWVKQNNDEPQLPGLNYTPNQMFWISAAQSRCTKYMNEYLKLSVTTGYHAPEEFRILGTFSNSDYFSKDFNCPLGSIMNPKNKCVVW